MKIGRFKLFEKYVIGPPSNPYMIRWRLIETPWFGVFFHRILRDDADRHLHDHPWPFVSVILRGGYFEHRNVELRDLDMFGNPAVVGSEIRETWHGPGSVIRHAATDFHRVALRRKGHGWQPDAVIPAWTLVFIGRR